MTFLSEIHTLVVSCTPTRLRVWVFYSFLNSFYANFCPRFCRTVTCARRIHCCSGVRAVVCKLLFHELKRELIRCLFGGIVRQFFRELLIVSRLICRVIIQFLSRLVRGILIVQGRVEFLKVFRQEDGLPMRAGNRGSP